MNSFISNFKKNYGRVVVELLGLCLLLLVFDRLLFALIRRGEASFYRNVSPYSLNDKFARIKKKSDYQALILGTSRTYDAIHPFYIRKELGIKAFKEAFVGKGPMYNYYFYQEYKKHFPVPRLVLYGLDYFLYNVTTERHWMQRFDQDVVNSVYQNSGFSMLLANKANIDSLINTVLNSWPKKLVQNDNLMIEQDIFRMENYLGLASAGDLDPLEPPHFSKFFFFEYPGQEGVYFSRLLEELRRDRVTVLLVSLPEFIGTYRSNKSHRQFRRAFRLYQRKYDHVHFLDYNHSRKFVLHNPEYFIDGGYGKTNSHLSRRGAEIFNRMLIEDLRKFLPQNEIQTGK